MPDNVSGHIQVDITSNDVGDVTGGRSESSTGGRDGKKQLKFFETMSQNIKRYMPLLAVGGGILALTKYSKVGNIVMQSIFEILGTIMDIFLVPLMPIFTKIMEATVELVPKLITMADKIIGPLVELLMPIAEWMAENIPKIGEWIENLTPEQLLLAIFGVGAVLTGAMVLGKMFEGFVAITATRLLGLLFGNIAITSSGVLGAIGWPVITAAALFAALGITTVIEGKQTAADIMSEQGAADLDELNRNLKDNDKSLLDKIGDLAEYNAKYRVDPSLFWPGYSGYATGTHYVPRTGLYQLHRGEEVRTSADSSDNRPIIVENTFNVGIDGTIGIDEFVSEVERRMQTVLTNILRR